MICGFIAEDVMPLSPELVKPTGEDASGLSINYAGFIVGAIQAAILEHQAKIEELQQQVTQLEKLV